MTDKVLDKLAKYDFHDTSFNYMNYNAVERTLCIELEFWDNVNNCEALIDFHFKNISAFHWHYPNDIEFVPEGCYNANFKKLNSALYQADFLFELHPNIDCWEVSIKFTDIEVHENQTNNYAESLVEAQF